MDTAPEADTLPLTVAKARDTTEGRVVTLQTLPAHRISGGPTPRAAFVSAVQRAGQLDHPNIARVFDQGMTEAGDLFVVGEYTRGITLKERIRRIAPFSLAVAADIAVAIAEALENAHAAGVTHGDLRPHHVLLSPEGQIKVGNFAYSRAAMQLTSDGPDPLYAAYVPAELGPRAAGTVAGDIYALGATLYEMLTGAQPAQNMDEAPSPRSLNPGVPPALEGIVQKALQPQPLARYRAVTAMLADLRTVREALRTGRSLAWSPVGEKRIPRSPDPNETGPESRPTDPSRTIMIGEPIPPGVDTAEPAEPRDDSPGRVASRAFGIIVAILFVVAVCSIIGLSWYFTRFIAIPNDIQVPSLIGKTFDEAKQIADRDHFQLIEHDPDTPHYSATWPENQIYQQDPPASRTIKAGREVYVWRSAGPAQLRVPDLTELPQDRAAGALQDAGLPGAVTEDYSATIPKGYVISQQPAKHAMVPRNTTVNYVVSQGEEPPDVPENVVATPGDATTVTLTWTAAARAETYTVTRTQDGSSKTVAQDLKTAQVTDSGLTPATSYTYTVTAVNAGGSSGPSEPVTTLTPPVVPVPPTLSPDTPAGPGAPDNVGAGADNPDAPPAPPGGTDGGSPRLRQFTINFRVPRHPRRQRHVQFEIQDALGLSQAFDEYRDPDSEIDAPVHAFGNRVTFRIFLDGKLARQQTL